ncbi:PTS system fructose-specific IIC component [Entomoplasma freundtii]|uniref:PTS system, fructose-specific IIABC component n=1 Tax=Entomoplasma freundtii TaxID=74700 RepID=A0A2K8NR35_9MOLU|nr:fructose-specific PTS transporter subunit EIIC [Entomoplasma freundtii]ATZ16279.1 PTS system, fructose-specific IIABC component [Entomoplasma freundtii]TDY56820.1 PTS system fructose-specific IIC component [Entomoplasma freundtii]
MNNQVFNKDYIYLDVDLKDQKDAFEFIAEKAYSLNLVASKESLIKGFEARENEGSTGFEDGFAIPHSRIKEVKQAAVFVVRLKKAIDWNSMDGKPTQILIALLVPEGPNGDQHLSILSDVAVKLMDEEFKTTLNKTESVEEVLQALNKEKNATTNEVSEQANTSKSLNILAITACAVGIAHTFMAEDKLLKVGKEMGHNIRVETHGSKGVGTPFTDAEIASADVVIFATDVNVDKDRFGGKKFYQTGVAKAIKNPTEIINNAIEQGTILDLGTNGFDNSKGKKASSGPKTGLLQHILAGISYMIPVIVLGGICLAFSLGLAKAIWGPEAGTKGPIVGIDANGNDIYKSPWGPLAVLELIGASAFTLMIPILAGFIANSIAGRAAIAPAMVGAFIGNDAGKFMPLPGMSAVQTPTGFVGALIAGILVGYFVKWVNTWKVPRSLAPAMPIFFIPLMAGIGISLLFIYAIGGPIGFVMDKISHAINRAYQGNVGIWVGLGLGAVLGAMAGFDMGGPINKIAFVTCAALVTDHIYQPMGAMAAAIPVAPMAMGLSTLLFKKFFTEEERNLGVAALIMGTIGISEGAIPFAIRDPRRAIIANVSGSLVAGGIAGAFGVTDAAAHGGPIVAILGAVPYGLMTLWYFLAVICGVAVTTSVYGLWMNLDARRGKGVGFELIAENEAKAKALPNKKAKLFKNKKQATNAQA